MTLTEIIEADAVNNWRAEQCLRALSGLRVDDLARPELIAAAQTFALLSIADELHLLRIDNA